MRAAHHFLPFLSFLHLLLLAFLFATQLQPNVMMLTLLVTSKVPLTDAFAVFKEGERSMPGVQVNTDDRSLTKP